MRRHFLIIHNKMAGLRNGPVLARVKKRLQQQGAQFELKPSASLTEDIELARVAAQEKQVDGVVAAGGDSTIRGVAMGLLGTQMPMGIIPAGTGNVLAEEIGLSRRPAQIASTLMEGETQPIGMGLANGEPFLLMAGAGFDADIVKHLDHALKQRIHKAAYLWPTLRALFHKSRPIRVYFDQEQQEQQERFVAQWVVVTRARRYGGRFIMAPRADITSDELQVVMFMNQGRFGLVRALIGLARGHNAKQIGKMDFKAGGQANRMRTKGVLIRTCNRVRIDSQEPVPVQVDGEWIGSTPLEVTTADQRVNLIIPDKSR